MSVALDELVLSCPVTFEPYASEAGQPTTPVVLPCGHTVSYIIVAQARS